MTRPGGAALNAGQVFGQRCAEHIAVAGREPAPMADVGREIDALRGALATERGLSLLDIEREVQARMSDHAGFVCSPEGVRDALGKARQLNADIAARGLAIDRPEEAGRAWQWRQMALVSEAVLFALDAYLKAGGGSRGARAVCDPTGARVPIMRDGPLEEFRFRAEREADRERKLAVRYSDGAFCGEVQNIRRRDRGRRAYFERDWGRFLSGAIYAD